ncbi:MAG TPA: dTDP-4-dehydrorhamnose 3,5-epimerase family protein [Beijerinckiaceae bacterium]|jgi:dTDP-4-dehydrorhamnose 3,5-epimerase
MAATLDDTLKSAVRDVATVASDGRPLQPLIEGVSFRPAPTHADVRGSVVEMFDPRWQWYPDPLVFAYCFTIRPGVAKGWNLHREHEDRYFLLQGEMELVLYDPRPGSPTFGRVSRMVLSEHNRGLVNVPRDVWHADHNIGTADVVVVNFPTRPYDHADPDKYRLPLDTPLIPHRFPPGTKGW